MKKINILLAFLLSFPLYVSGWGQMGHDTTCKVAENHLTRKARKHISKVLDGQSIVYWANWLDNASHTPKYEYSLTWHYKNIDAGETFENAPLNPKGDLVKALYELTEKIKTGRLSKEEEALTLKMIVHLVGDLHQPMHFGHKSDLGGNKVDVDYFGTHMPLHTVWDTDLIESGHRWSHHEWAEYIDTVSRSEAKKIVDGDFTSWGKETFEICKRVYDETPADKPLSYDYVAKWTPIVEKQFLKGGLRLAKVLNDIYR